MTMWAHNGKRWQKRSFGGVAVGSDIYLCCPGPSLRELDPTLLTRPGLVTIAVNKAYPIIPRPDYWLGMDHPSCFAASLMWESFPKILRGSWNKHKMFGVELFECPNAFFVDIDDQAHPVQVFERLGDEIKLIAPLRNSFEAALHFAIWLGGKRIHLVGCDFGGTRDYCDETQLTDVQRKSNRRLYGLQVRHMAHLVLEGKMHGVEFVSCTADSPVNAILEYLPLAEATERSAERVPQGWTPTPHCRVAAQCRWRGKVEQDRGVVVGVIEEQAWMLEWWLTNFREHNPTTPVAFADFGVSEHWKAWCRENGTLIEVDAPESVTGWFRKPFAVLAAPFKRIIWFDLDTEVRGSVHHIFEYCADGAIAAGPTNVMTTPEYAAERDRDWYVMLPPAAVKFCGGMIVTERGNAAIEEWALNSVPPREHEYLGDQEILGQVVHRRGTPFHPLAASEFSLSRRRGDKNATVLHYAGKQAKEQLKHLLTEHEALPVTHNGNPPTMTDEERAKLLDAVASATEVADTVRILEIGVADGQSSVAMMRKCAVAGKRFQYIGVDALTWRRPTFPADLLEHGTIDLVPFPSTQAVPNVRRACPNGFHVVLVDGCHCAKCAEADVKNYAPMVVPGGYLLMHDVTKPDFDCKQIGSGHKGHGVRPVYLAAREAEGWADLGETGTRYGLGCMQRALPAVTSQVAAEAAG